MNYSGCSLLFCLILFAANAAKIGEVQDVLYLEAYPDRTDLWNDYAIKRISFVLHRKMRKEKTITTIQEEPVISPETFQSLSIYPTQVAYADRVYDAVYNLRTQRMVVFTAKDNKLYWTNITEPANTTWVADTNQMRHYDVGCRITGLKMDNANLLAYVAMETYTGYEVRAYTLAERISVPRYKVYATLYRSPEPVTTIAFNVREIYISIWKDGTAQTLYETYKLRRDNSLLAEDIHDNVMPWNRSDVHLHSRTPYVDHIGFHFTSAIHGLAIFSEKEVPGCAYFGSKGVWKTTNRILCHDKGGCWFRDKCWSTASIPDRKFWIQATGQMDAKSYNLRTEGHSPDRFIPAFSMFEFVERLNVLYSGGSEHFHV